MPKRRGNSKGFMRRIKRLINDSDLVIELVDSRFAEETRNKTLENLIIQKGKKFVIAVSKADLVSKRFAEKTRKKLSRETRTIIVSGKERKGLNDLRKAINISLGKKGGKVGIIGYPNVGKSSLINALKGKKVAKTSIKAGYTRGEQIFKITETIYLIDSPGIIPFNEKDEFNLTLFLSKNANQLKEPELTALKLIDLFNKSNPSILEDKYGLEEKDAEIFLEKLAMKKKRVKKGNIPDCVAAAKIVINDYQKGKINFFKKS